MLTLKQLGRHSKAIAIYNLCGYYDEMNNMIENAIEKNFMKDTCRQLYKFFTDADKMLDYIENYKGEAIGARYFKNI